MNPGYTCYFPAPSVWQPYSWRICTSVSRFAFTLLWGNSKSILALPLNPSPVCRQQTQKRVVDSGVAIGIPPDNSLFSISLSPGGTYMGSSVVKRVHQCFPNACREYCMFILWPEVPDEKASLIFWVLWNQRWVVGCNSTPLLLDVRTIPYAIHGINRLDGGRGGVVAHMKGHKYLYSHVRNSGA